jgi:transposase
MEYLHMNLVLDILSRFRRGESIRSIGRDLDLCRNTVRKYVELAREHGLLAPETPLPGATELATRLFGDQGGACQRGRPAGVGLWLVAHRDLLKEFLKAGVDAQVIHQRLCSEHGFTGSYSTVRRHLEKLAEKDPEAFCRLETKPGDEAQVDFGYAGIHPDTKGVARKTWVFVMVLSHSRHRYDEFVHDQGLETWIGCHERAFRHFGGVPRRVVIDNLKAGVVSHALNDAVLAEPYRRLARHYGFQISPNRPRTPHHKGKVERGVAYVKGNFLAGRTFTDSKAMNEAVLVWIREQAGVRIHGTTRQAPLRLFEDLEKAALQPLPAEDFEWTGATVCKVNRDCHVIVDKVYYSVPHKHVGTMVDVYLGKNTVEIYSGQDLLTTHERGLVPGEKKTREAHYPEGKRAWIENPPERCLERARQVGPACHQVVSRLLTDRIQDRIGSVHSLLRLGEKLGNDRLEAGCLRALHYEDPSYRRVKLILGSGLDASPIPEPTGRVLEMQSFRFARPSDSFFQGGSQ